MANVDPFVIKWPSKWLNDQEIGPVIRYLNRFLHDLWQRSGGGNDIVIDLQDQIDAIIIRLDLIEGRLDVIESDIVAIQARLDVLEALVFIQITAPANHTTTRNENITCINTAAITVSANAAPAANEEIHTMRAGSLVTIDGNGKLIMGVAGGNNGVSSYTLNIKGQGSQMVFNTDTDKWHIK